VRCLRNYAAAGITSVGVAGGSPADLLDFQKARDAGSPVRVSFMYRDSYFVAARDLGLRTGFGDEFLKLGSVKIFHGNSLSGRTCWLKEEYSDRPGYFGIPPARSQEDLDRLILNVHRAGWQAAVHSNGDREIEMVLTAIERAQAAHPRSDARHRIEHASVCTPEILKRAKAAGVVLVFHSYQWEHGDKQESYGEKRLNMMHPHRSALDLGIAVAGHSDHPVSAAIPMLRIHDLVNRQGENGKVYGPAQRIGVEEALRVFTLGSAHAQFEEKEKGSIAAGKLADFLVLAEDPRAVPASRIKDIRVMETWIGGKRAAGGEGTPGSN
jgi:predicted amidohydrolase YtcJ